MGWLANWDDLIHGTAVFGAAVPFFAALILAAWQQHRIWIALPGAIAIPLLWLFGLPQLPPKTSDNTLVPAWILATGLLILHQRLNPELKWRFTPAIRILTWTGLAWSIYPAWLSAEGGEARRLMITLAIGISISAWSFLLGFLLDEERIDPKPRWRLTPVALIPPTVALSVLLQLGGSTQFAQSAGALASAVTAVALIHRWKPAAAGLASTGAFWAMLFGLLAWSGWLFAEIHAPAAAALLLAPVAGAAANLLSQQKSKRPRLWECLGSTAVSIPVIWAGWARYSNSQTGY